MKVETIRLTWIGHTPYDRRNKSVYNKHVKHYWHAFLWFTW